ncbi:hypothetical protein MIC448_260035 [Microbacterium sp. C448]|nr:hypothetical protein MIC448_260035 [Microbacterium sp. C448]
MSRSDALLPTRLATLVLSPRGPTRHVDVDFGFGPGLRFGTGLGLDVGANRCLGALNTSNGLRLALVDPVLSGWQRGAAKPTDAGVAQPHPLFSRKAFTRHGLNVSPVCEANAGETTNA